MTTMTNAKIPNFCCSILSKVDDVDEEGGVDGENVGDHDDDVGNDAEGEDGANPSDGNDGDDGNGGLGG